MLCYSVRKGYISSAECVTQTLSSSISNIAMRHMFHVCKHPLRILILLGVFVSSVYAQSDTVEYRLLRSMITDSTRVRFELGSVGFKHAGSVRYLRFVNNFPTIPSEFFRTDTFTVAGATDSIRFFRFASFDDKYEIGEIPCGEIGSPTWDSALALLKRRYVDSDIVVAPDTSIFNPFSTIRYDLELHNAVSDSLIRTIDTLICFRTASGSLAYTTIPIAENGGTIALAGIATGTHLYATIHRFGSLPPGVSFIEDHYDLNAWNPAYVGPVSVDDSTTVRYADGRVYPPASPIPPAAVRVRSEPIGERRATYDLASSLVKETFNADADGDAQIRLVDNRGRVVFQSTNVIHLGSNTIAIDCGTLPSGSYFIDIRRAGKLLLISHRIIIH
jgi:hypothetical protein